MAKSTLSSAVGFYLGYPLLWLIGWLPLGLLYGVSDLFYLLVAAIGYRRKVITGNLQKSFPDKSAAEIQKIRLRFYRHFCDLFVEILVLQHISPKKIQKRVKLVNQEVLQSMLDEGHDIVAVLGHYGNWEWIPVSSLSINAVGLSVYRPLKNVYFDRFMLQLRGLFGSRNIPLKATAREIVKYKRSQQRFVLGLISDQSPSKQELHYWTTFLNQNTPIILGPEKMAKLAKAKIVYWKMEKLKRGHYQITFIPYEGDVTTAPEFAITEWQVRLLEQQIIQQPEYWLWSHKRWKYQHLYKNNQQ
ncbi:MAG: lysophospholipid acyltransferase family protein [Bacteroidales bacterium]|nr:lysophospholipid acyltransferase family protein [Bacteroidales bacterium]